MEHLSVIRALIADGILSNLSFYNMNKEIQKILLHDVYLPWRLLPEGYSL
jgi:hypothetical protein